MLKTAEKVREEVGDVTILVNNAGILPCRPLKDHSPELIEKIFSVNVFAHFWVSILIIGYLILSKNNQTFMSPGLNNALLYLTRFIQQYSRWQLYYTLCS